MQTKLNHLRNETLIRELERATEPSNALDIAVEIALFKPDTTYASVRPNMAGTKLVYTLHNGSTRLSQATRKDQMTGTEGLTAERKFKSKELQDIYEQGWKDALLSQDESGWQDIATAPTDGTEVWVYVAEREGLPAFQTRCAHHPDAGWCADELREVTHWQPLPCPPAPREETAT